MLTVNPMSRCDLPPEILDKIKFHSQSSPTEEVCGLILGKEIFYPCRNTSIDPQQFAIIDSKEIIEASRIAPISHHYHSHVGRSRFSREFTATDIKTCRKDLRVPWILHHTISGSWDYYDPEYKAPLVGRQWRWAYQNCFNLFQDYFEALGIYIDDFYLDSPEAWKSGSVGYVENLPGQGFAQVPETWPLKNHDVVLMWIRSQHPNHVGVVVDADRGVIVHHMANQLSKPEAIDRFDKTVHSVWRHRNFI